MTTCSLYIDDLYSDDNTPPCNEQVKKKSAFSFNLLRVFQILVNTLMHIFIIVVNYCNIFYVGIPNITIASIQK